MKCEDICMLYLVERGDTHISNNYVVNRNKNKHLHFSCIAKETLNNIPKLFETVPSPNLVVRK